MTLELTATVSVSHQYSNISHAPRRKTPTYARRTATAHSVLNSVYSTLITVIKNEYTVNECYVIFVWCCVAIECTVELKLNSASIDDYSDVIEWLTTTSVFELSGDEVTESHVARPT